MKTRFERDSLFILLLKKGLEWRDLTWKAACISEYCRGLTESSIGVHLSLMICILLMLRGDFWSFGLLFLPPLAALPALPGCPLLVSNSYSRLSSKLKFTRLETGPMSSYCTLMLLRGLHWMLDEIRLLLAIGSVSSLSFIL